MKPHPIHPDFVEEEGCHEVSLVRLIATPDRYHASRVRVVGFLDLVFEGWGLYLHEHDAVFSINANAVAIEPDDAILKRRDSLNNRYVLIEGMYDQGFNGHRGAFPSGGLVRIGRCETRSRTGGGIE